jgi:hypothetical protein
MAAFVPTDKPIQRGSLNLGSQLFTLSRDGSCSNLIHGNDFLVASFTGWLLLHLKHGNSFLWLLSGTPVPFPFLSFSSLKKL